MQDPALNRPGKVFPPRQHLQAAPGDMDRWLLNPSRRSGGYQSNATVNCLIDDGQAICAIRRESVSSSGRKAIGDLMRASGRATLIADAAAMVTRTTAKD